MKATIGFSLGLAVALIPFAGGGDPTSTNSNPEVAPADQVSGDSSNDASSAINILPGPDIPPSAEATGPGTTVPPAPRVSLTPPAADVAKLAQAGVDESVMLTFITNSPNTFNLSSDAIVYLNDLGISSEVVNAMIQHDQTLRANIALSPTPTAEFNPPLPANAGAGNPVDTTNPDSTASAQTEPTYTENPPDLTENAEAAAEPNGSYTYFYNSLAPYGSWISVGGYGPCWRPTACVITPGWQPYCNAGHWVYTDCGWYWASSYSWGWAPYHYGRWFYAPTYGWCWSPGRVWSPAWVCWRYTSDHCGWAPLPPSAYYRPGVGFSYYGRSVGLSFNFGLQASSFVFVPTTRFCDPHPAQYRVASVGAVNIYNHSVPYNRFAEGQNHVVINQGIPVDRISAVTHTTIRPVALRDVSPSDGTRPGLLGGNTLAVYRPVPQIPAHGGPLSTSSNPSIPTAHPVGTVTYANPGLGARSQSPVPIYRNQVPVTVTAPARPWSPAQGNPAPTVRTAPPQNTWSLPRRGEGGNQIATTGQDRGYTVRPAPVSESPLNWANNPMPVRQLPPPVTAQFAPRPAPVQAASAPNNSANLQPTRSAPPPQQQQQQGQPYGGFRR